MAQFVNILRGDTAPGFIQRSTINPRFVFDTTAGRYLVLCFFGSARDPKTRAFLKEISGWTDIFDDTFGTVFPITADRQDELQKRLPTAPPAHRCILDYDLSVSRAYGSAPVDTAPTEKQVQLQTCWIVLDPGMRVLKRIPIGPDINHTAELKAYLKSLPPPDSFAGVEIMAPVLFLPNVFEPELCQKLIDLYQTSGGTESGFMREENGKTVLRHDHSHKRRRDHIIEDDALCKELQGRVRRRIVPQIHKAYQFNVTRMERYIVSCYSQDEKGHFRAHRDNTTKGTAHRRFAVSINLNSEFEGGEISFPEYGSRSFKPPPGGAVVFSCSLLHAVSPVTKGQRYAFLPFLYDDAAAEIRRKNNTFLSEEVGSYRG